MFKVNLLQLWTTRLNSLHLLIYLPNYCSAFCPPLNVPYPSLLHSVFLSRGLPNQGQHWPQDQVVQQVVPCQRDQACGCKPQKALANVKVSREDLPQPSHQTQWTPHLHLPLKPLMTVIYRYAVAGMLIAMQLWRPCWFNCVISINPHANDICS